MRANLGRRIFEARSGAYAVITLLFAVPNMREECAIRVTSLPSGICKA